MNKTQKVKQPASSQSFLLENQIKNPERLKMLILCGSNLARSDFMFIMNCTGLIKLDLSSNGLVRFPIEFSLVNLKSLSFLHLHNNEFRNIEDLKPVFETSNLLQLTLYNNPLPMNPRIEHFILNVLKKLKVINDRVIFEEERLSDVFVTRPIVRIDLDAVLPQNKNNDERYYIWLLQLQFFYIQSSWARANPIVRLQRKWKAKLKEKQRSNIVATRYARNFKQLRTEQLRNPNLPIYAQYFQAWKDFYVSMKKIKKHLKSQDKSYMQMPLKQYEQHQRNERVKPVIKAYLQKIRMKIQIKKAIEVFKNHLAPRVALFQSNDCFYSISGIQQTKRIMLIKHQKHILLNFIQHAKRSMPDRNPTWKIIQNKSYISVRHIEQERLNSKRGDGVYSMFLYPSMHCVFLKNKKQSIKKAKKTAISIKQLPYLTRKLGHLTQPERESSNKKFNKVSKYMENQYYGSLLQFYCQDDVFFKQILRFIYYHNTGSCTFKKIVQNSSQALAFLDNYNQNFIFYFDKLLKRSTAAVLIQKCWKRYWNNKNSVEALHAKIKEARAAQRIQKFVRSMKFFHRQSFDISLNLYLRDIDSNCLYIQKIVYFQLKKLLRKKDLYEKLALWANKSHKDVLITWHFPRDPLFAKTVNRLKISQFNIEDEIRPVDIYHLLHYGSEVSAVTSNGQTQFIKFTFGNVQTAKKRAAYLALMTYQFKMGFFIRLFTKELLNHDDYMIRYANTLELVHSVKLPSIVDFSLRQTVVRIHDNSFISTENGDHHIAVEFYQQDNINTAPIKKEQTLHIRFTRPKMLLDKTTASPIKSVVPMLKDIPELKIEEDPSKKRISTLRRNYEKRLSFYDVTIDKNDGSQKRHYSTSKAPSSDDRNDSLDPTINQQAEQTSPNQTKTDWLHETQKSIKMQRESHLNRMHQISERDKMYMTKIRRMHLQQKAKNLTAKMSKESEQLTMNRLKVERIEQIGREMRQTRISEQKHENSFLQKGNFLIKQQVKMRRIREDYQQSQKKKEAVSKMALFTKVAFVSQNVSTRKMPSRQSVSEEKSRKGDQQQKEPTLQPIRAMRRGASFEGEGSETNRQSQLSSVQRLIVPTTQDLHQLAKLAKKKDKIIHAVFPQEFYAIDKRNSILPKIQKGLI